MHVFLDRDVFRSDIPSQTYMIDSFFFSTVNREMGNLKAKKPRTHSKDFDERSSQFLMLGDLPIAS